MSDNQRESANSKGTLWQEIAQTNPREALTITCKHEKAHTCKLYGDHTHTQHPGTAYIEMPRKGGHMNALYVKVLTSLAVGLLQKLYRQRCTMFWHKIILQ